MRSLLPGLLSVALLTMAVAAQTLPPPFPRTGATQLLDNERVTVWDYAKAASASHSHPMDTFVVWTEGRAGHAVFLPAGTVHTEEPIGASTKATIFELK
jgi:quercetin dioxygenase-like cupin family protein